MVGAKKGNRKSGKARDWEYRSADERGTGNAGSQDGEVYHGADSAAHAEKAGMPGSGRPLHKTVIVFSLGDDLVSPDYIYRVEMVDSLNRYITTENIVLPPGGAEISVPLTREWTRSAGLCEIRAVVSKLNSEFGEELVFHTPPAHIYFDGRVEGVSAEREEGRGLTALIESVRDVSDRAREALDGFSGMVAAALNEAKSYADAAAEGKADKSELIKTRRAPPKSANPVRLQPRARR